MKQNLIWFFIFLVCWLNSNYSIFLDHFAKILLCLLEQNWRPWSRIFQTDPFLWNFFFYLFQWLILNILINLLKVILGSYLYSIEIDKFKFLILLQFVNIIWVNLFVWICHFQKFSFYQEIDNYLLVFLWNS